MEAWKRYHWYHLHIFHLQTPKRFCLYFIFVFENMPEPCQWGLSNQQKKTSVQRNTPLKTSFSKRWPGTVLLVAIGDETLEGIPGHLSFGRVKLIRVYLVQLLGFADWVGSLDHVGIYTNEQMTTEDFPHLRLAASTVVPLPLHAPFLFLSCSATRSSEGAFEVRWCVRWRVEVNEGWCIWLGFIVESMWSLSGSQFFASAKRGPVS